MAPASPFSGLHQKPIELTELTSHRGPQLSGHSLRRAELETPSPVPLPSTEAAVVVGSGTRSFPKSHPKTTPRASSAASRYLVSYLLHTPHTHTHAQVHSFYSLFSTFSTFARLLPWYTSPKPDLCPSFVPLCCCVTSNIRNQNTPSSSSRPLVVPLSRRPVVPWSR